METIPNINNYGTLIICDNSEAGTGKTVARGLDNYGTMVINSGAFAAADGDGGAAVWNEPNASLTINGGTFTAPAGADGSYGTRCVNNDRGTVKITGGTFTSKNERMYAIISSGDIAFPPAEGSSVEVSGVHGGLAVDAGTAVINGGSFDSTDYYGLYVSNDGIGTGPMAAAVTVNGGTFGGKEYSVWAGSDMYDPVDSAVEITGGTFTKPINAQDTVKDGAVSVSGGTFSEPVPENTARMVMRLLQQRTPTVIIPCAITPARKRWRRRLPPVSLMAISHTGTVRPADGISATKLRPQK